MTILFQFISEIRNTFLNFFALIFYKNSLEIVFKRLNLCSLNLTVCALTLLLWHVFMEILLYDSIKQVTLIL